MKILNFFFIILFRVEKSRLHVLFFYFTVSSSSPLIFAYKSASVFPLDVLIAISSALGRHN